MAAAKSSTAAKKPAAKPAVAESKPAAKPAVAESKPAAKPASPPVATAAKRALDPEVRARMIAEAAYYIAEKRGFIHGHHDADWAEAERQIDALLSR